MGWFTPAWMKDDGKSEKKALEYVEKLTKQPELAQIALQAPRHAVRLAAVKKLTDQNALAQVVVNHPGEASEALIKLTDGAALQYVIDNDSLTAHRIRAAAKLPDHERGQRIIGEAALRDKEEAVRIESVMLLDDEFILAQVAINEINSVRAVNEAISRISDLDLLARVAREGKRGYGRSYALSKISDPKLREETSRALLVDPKGGTDVWQTALEYTDDQEALVRLVRMQGPHKDLKIHAVQKITDVAFLNEILHSDDEAFRFSVHTFSADGARGISFTSDLKPYAEQRLNELNELDDKQ